MAKKLTDILKTQPTKRTFSLGNMGGGYHPHKGETGTKAFLSKLTVNDHGEPFENDFLGGVKTFDRAAHRYGHANIDYNNVDNKGGLKDPNVEVSETDPNPEDLEMLGEVLDAYFEENPDASYHQAYTDIMEEMKRLDEQWPKWIPGERPDALAAKDNKGYAKEQDRQERTFRKKGK